MNYYIYLIKNKINNKIYIGKRKCPDNKTPQTDKYMGSGLVLKRAIEKYGIDQFEKEILIENIDTVELINILEKQYIILHDSINRHKGYNRTAGGDGGNTIKFFTEEELEAYKAKFRGKKLSEESKQKLREKVNLHAVNKNLKKARKKYNELIVSGWRPIVSLKTRELMSMKSKISHNKKVMCIDTGIIYDSMNDAANKTNSSISKISMCCNGKRNKTNKLRWKFLQENQSK